MNAAIYIVSLSLLACCICQEIIDRSYFSKRDQQSCCKNENREREIVSKIEKLELAILDLHEPLGNTISELQEQLRNSTVDIQALKESNSNLQEQLRNSTADIQALKEQVKISTSDIQTLNQSNLQEQFQNAGLAHCVAGSYSNTGLVPCKLCEIGTYQISAGSTTCKPCEFGTYQPSPGSTLCLTCGAGKWTLTTGRTADTDCKAMGTDCEDTGSALSGVYTIKSQGVDEPFSVYCDMQTVGEGWTVFQRRQDGSVNFYRDWASYETGFGDLMGEFWLGNRFLHSLTNQDSYQLRVNLTDFDGNASFAHYNVFSVGKASSNYYLNVSGYSGNAGDSLEYVNNREFSTYDRDHDVLTGRSCAKDTKGAWWFGSCSNSHLNGEYVRGGTPTSYAYGLHWRHWRGDYYSLKSSTMSVRRRHSR